MPRIINLSLIFFYSLSCLSQQDKALRDSIIKYQFSNPSLAIDFGFKYVELVQSKTPDSLVIGTHAMIGEILSDMGLYASAIEYFNRALDLYQTMPDKNKANPEISQPPWIILNIGSIYFKNGDYKKAEEKFNQAKSIFLNLPDKQSRDFGLNTSDSNLGLIDETKGDYQSAEKKYFSVYQRRLKSKKPEDILYSISQLIAVNFLKGDINSAENKFEQLKQYYSENKNNQE